MLKKKKGNLVIIGVSLLAVVIFAAIPYTWMYLQHKEHQGLDRPTPSKADSTSKKDSETKANNKNATKSKQGTAENPFFIQFLPSIDNHQETKAETKTEEGRTSGEWWIAYLTVALMAFTGGLMVFTALLWTTTQKVMEADEEMTKITERARLSAGPAKTGIKNEKGEVEKTVVMLRIANFGNTIAYLERISYSYERDAKRLWDKRSPLTNIIPPTMTGWLPSDVHFEFPTERKVFWGRVYYNDIWGDPHWTEFKHYIYPDGSTEVMQGAETEDYQSRNRRKTKEEIEEETRFSSHTAPHGDGS